MRKMLWVLLVVPMTASGGTLDARIDEYVAPLVQSHGFSGVVLVARGDKPVAVRTYGMADYAAKKRLSAESRFPVASITKTFTGAMVAMLAERGKLSVDDKLAKYAPSFPHAEEITLLHLLWHQSGVPNPDLAPCSGATLEDLVADLAKKPLWFEPGTDNGYSNGGYAMLAYVIEKVTGKRWEDALRDEIFKPLGLTSTMRDSDAANIAKRASGYIPGPGATGLANAPCQSAAAAFGSGALVSSATDLHRWGRAMAKETLFKRTKLKHPYGWGVRTYHDHAAIEQNGIIHGFSSYLALYPEDDLYVIVLSNVQTSLLTRMGIGLAGIVLGKDVPKLPVPPATVAATPEQRKLWAGRYKSDQSPLFTLEERDGVLYQTWADDTDGSYVFPTGPTTAFNRQENSALTLEGDVLKLSWDGNTLVELRRVK